MNNKENLDSKEKDKNTLNNLSKNIYQINYNKTITNFYLPNLSDYIQKRIYTSHNFYEIEMLEDIKNKGFEKKVIIDAGANIGNHTLFFSKICNASKVYSFEPQKEIFQILKKNIEINNLEKNVFAYNNALGSQNAMGYLYDIDSSNLGKTKIRVDLVEGETPIETLNNIIYNIEPKIHLIKIDVEGMEVEVLKGASKILHRDKPLLYVEAFNTTAYNNITSYLSSFGYKAISCFNKTPTYLYQAKTK